MKLNFKDLGNKFAGIITKYSPEILTGLGIAGMLTTVVLAVKATPKAMELIEEKKEEEKTEELKPIETVKTAWKCYIPAAAMGTVSTACLIFANSASSKQRAALATAYSVSERAFKEYEEKVIETVGEKKEKEIKKAIVEDKIAEPPAKEIIFIGGCKNIFKEPISGKIFESTEPEIQKKINDLNRRMRSEETISFNEYLIELGLKTVPYGDDIGWNIDKGYIDISSYTPELNDNFQAYITFAYSNPPVHDFR